MEFNFVIKVDGVDIKVLCKSFHNQFGHLAHMELVGSLYFTEVKSGKPRGEAHRYNQSCD